MQAQEKLLNSSAYWYAIPPFIINFIFIIGLGDPTIYNWTNRLAETLLPLTLSFKIGTLIGLTFFYIFIIYINKKAVQKDITPLLESTNSLLLQLKHK